MIKRISASAGNDIDNLAKSTQTAKTSNGRGSDSESLVDEVVRSAQHRTHEALAELARAVDELRHGAASLLGERRTSQEMSAMARRGLEAMRDSSRDLRNRAERVSHQTESYIQDRPMKSVLIAAATGAALMALVAMLAPVRRRR